MNWKEEFDKIVDKYNFWKQDSALMEYHKLFTRDITVFIENEVIEKLIEEIPDSGKINDTGIFRKGTITTDQLKQQLRKKWLQKGDE